MINSKKIERKFLVCLVLSLILSFSLGSGIAYGENSKVTDDEGEATFENVPYGSYEITIKEGVTDEWRFENDEPQATSDGIGYYGRLSSDFIPENEKEKLKQLNSGSETGDFSCRWMAFKDYARADRVVLIPEKPPFKGLYNDAIAMADITGKIKDKKGNEYSIHLMATQQWNRYILGVHKDHDPDLADRPAIAITGDSIEWVSSNEYYAASNHSSIYPISYIDEVGDKSMDANYRPMLIKQN